MEPDVERLSRLCEYAERCSRHLEAAALTAADPQARAQLLHRAGMQHRLAWDLSSVGGFKPRERPAPSDIVARDERYLLRRAARVASRLAASCGEMLREFNHVSDMSPTLQRTVARCYGDAMELEMLLRQRMRRLDIAARDRVPLRNPGAANKTAPSGPSQSP